MPEMTGGVRRTLPASAAKASGPAYTEETRFPSEIRMRLGFGSIVADRSGSNRGFELWKALAIPKT